MSSARQNCKRKKVMCNCVTTYLPNVSLSFLLFFFSFFFCITSTSTDEKKMFFKISYSNFLLWDGKIQKNAFILLMLILQTFTVTSPFACFLFFFFLPLLPDPTVSTKGIRRLSSIPSRRSWLVKGEITWLRGKSSFRAWQCWGGGNDRFTD